MALVGTLTDLTLIDLFHILPLGAKTGTVQLIQTPYVGVLWVAHGRLVDAHLAHHPQRRRMAMGASAVLAMLHWSQGVMIFRHDPQVATRPMRIVQSIPQLLHAAQRQRPAVPTRPAASNHRVFQQVRPAPFAPHLLYLTPLQYQVYQALATPQTLTTLQRSLHYPPDQVQHALTDVQVLGLVTTTHQSPRHPAARPLLTAIRQRLQRDAMA